MSINQRLVVLSVIYATIGAYVAPTNVCAAIVILIQGVVYFTLKVSPNYLAFVWVSNNLNTVNVNTSYLLPIHVGLRVEIHIITSNTNSAKTLINLLSDKSNSGAIICSFWLVYLTLSTVIDSLLFIILAILIHVIYFQPPRESGGTEATIGVS